jgi:COMM domain containing 2
LIECLVCLLIDCTRTNINENDFNQLIQTLGLVGGDHQSVLWQFVTSRKSLVETVLHSTDASDLHFRDLEWRLEARIASRCLLQQAVPTITMKFHLDREQINEHKSTIKGTDELGGEVEVSSKREVLLQTDPNNLVHMISVLEQALLEAKTHRTRNLMKTFQQ